MYQSVFAFKHVPDFITNQFFPFTFRARYDKESIGIERKVLNQ